MNTYGLTLQTCEGLIWAVRQERALWNSSWYCAFGHRGDGKCCLIGAYGRNIGSEVKNLMANDALDQFARRWFYKVADRMGLEPGSYTERNVKPSPGLRWLTLGKLRLIHDHLADEAEQREEISRWAPALVEAPSQKEVVPCGS